MKLDPTDLRILQLLQKDGRMTFQDLAQRVSLSSSPCLTRVHRLERAGVIKGYSAQIDISKIRPHFEALAEISLVQQGNHRQSAFIQHLQTLPALLELLEISGRSDYMARFGCSSLGEYRELVEALIENPTLGVANITSHIVMRTLVSFDEYNLTPLIESRDEE